MAFCQCHAKTSGYLAYKEIWGTKKLFGLSVDFGYNSTTREISMSEIIDITFSPEFIEKWKFVLKDFYDIFTDVMHRHGTPVFSPRLFEVLLKKYLGFLVRDT